MTKQESETTWRLDLEWTALILEAKKLGMSIQEIQAFFEQKRRGQGVLPSA